MKIECRYYYLFLQYVRVFLLRDIRDFEDVDIFTLQEFLLVLPYLRIVVEWNPWIQVMNQMISLIEKHPIQYQLKHW